MEGVATYEAKREIFISFGRSADKVSAEVGCAKRSKKESFHRFVFLVFNLVKDWATLAGVGDTEAAGDMAKAVGKQFS